MVISLRLHSQAANSHAEDVRSLRNSKTGLGCWKILLQALLEPEIQPLVAEGPAAVWTIAGV